MKRKLDNDTFYVDSWINLFGQMIKTYTQTQIKASVSFKITCIFRFKT